MVNLNGHEAGNGGHRQGTPKASRAFLYSEGHDTTCLALSGFVAALHFLRCFRKTEACANSNTARKNTPEFPEPSAAGLQSRGEIGWDRASPDKLHCRRPHRQPTEKQSASTDIPEHGREVFLSPGLREVERWPPLQGRRKSSQ